DQGAGGGGGGDADRRGEGRESRGHPGVRRVRGQGRSRPVGRQGREHLPETEEGGVRRAATMGGPPGTSPNPHQGGTTMDTIKPLFTATATATGGGHGPTQPADGGGGGGPAVAPGRGGRRGPGPP